MGVVEGFGVPQLWALGLRMGLMLLCFSRVEELWGDTLIEVEAL